MKSQTLSYFSQQMFDVYHIQISDVTSLLHFVNNISVIPHNLAAIFTQHFGLKFFTIKERFLKSDLPNLLLGTSIGFHCLPEVKLVKVST